MSIGFAYVWFYKGRHQGLVPERPISITPGLKFCSVFVFYILIHFVLSLLYLIVMLNSIFVTSSCMFLDKKTLLEIWLNPG